MDVEQISILLVEDDPGDARIVREYLSESSAAVTYHLTVCERLNDAVTALADGHFHLILLDLSLPDSSGIDTFQKIREQADDVAIVVLSNLEDEKLAVELVSARAQDYLVKDEINARLLQRAIRYSIQRRRAELERESLIAELQKALSQVKTLRGLVRICAWCGKVGTKDDQWTPFERYVAQHTEADFTHTMCGDCLEREQQNIQDVLDG